MSKSYYREYEASPPFPNNNPEIIVSGEWAIDYNIAHPISQKHLPLTTLKINNSSTSAISLHINHNKDGYMIPAGAVITFSKGTITPIWGWTVKNLSAAVIPAEKINIEAWKEAVEISDAFRKLHKAIYKLIYGYR